MPDLDVSRNPSADRQRAEATKKGEHSMANEHTKQPDTTPPIETDDDDVLPDRWWIDYSVSQDEFIARMHLRPGEEVPDWFEECPWCRGTACAQCDNTGRMHPTRAGNAEDYLLDASFHFGLFMELLRSDRVRLPRVYTAIADLGHRMGDYLDEWGESDPEVRRELDALERS